MLGGYVRTPQSLGGHGINESLYCICTTAYLPGIGMTTYFHFAAKREAGSDLPASVGC